MRALFTTAALLLVASNAYAADAVVADEVAVIAPDTFSWTGGYIGINAGYAGGKFKSHYEDTTVFIPNGVALRSAVAPYELGGSWEDNASGFVGGVQAGYNWQFQNGLVLGAEADFQGSTLKSKTSGSDDFGFGRENSELTTKVQWWGTVRARLGYTPTDRFLVYGTAGLAYGKVKTSYNYNEDYGEGETYSESFSSSKTKAGWTVGAGAEYAITNNWTLKSEYLYTDLGKARGQVSFNDYYNTYDFESKIKFHTVRVGLNYKF